MYPTISVALNKKSTKESNRWPQQEQSSPISTSSMNSGNCKTDDGGWSMGTPEKGSGWGSTRSYSANSDSWSNLDTQIGGVPEVVPESTSSELSLSHSNSWLCIKTSVTSNHQRPEQRWTVDNEEDNRSQSPGGLTMITSKDENGAASAPDKDLIGISRWGNPTSTLSNNWKISEKDNCDWDDTELSFGESSQSYTVSNGSHSLSKDQQSELEASALDRSDPGSYACVSERPRSGAGTPNSRSSGGATPTQETGGRASAGSTSSVNSIGSSSSWKSDGKGSKTYTNRVGSPRKPNR